MTSPNSTRLDRIARLFERARPLDTAARTELLHAEDTATRHEVEVLLARDADAHALLDDPLATLTADGPFEGRTPELSVARPDAIGPYRILDEIGAGGMGVVYRAQQESPRRIVALKVIRAPLASARTVRRFRYEAELLGRLQHPGIAQIYEARQSETPFGTQPYFAMEYVDGETLLTHAERHGLGVRERITLFLRVCAAVQHAHQRGIVHRDLKPSNILVDADGQPKVLDFGIARLLDPDGDETTLGTDVGQLMGTMPYMSPEQLAGDPVAIDAASDVYALGVILYELLTGQLPYDVRSKPWPEAARLIREAAPTPLARVSRAFRGDLDTIVCKALEKEPARRYASAADLASDVARFLRSEPIIARPASTAYQLRKFARRHRPVVAVIIALIVVLVAGVVTSTSLLVRTTHQAEALRRAIYGQNISLAQNAFDLNDMARMQEILVACDKDLRHWEWDRLSALADDSVAVIQAHRTTIGAIAFSPDGSLIATGATYDAAVPDARRDRSVQVWDVERRTRMYRLEDHRSALRDVAWNADGSTLATGGSAHWAQRESPDGAVRLWDIGYGGLQERRSVLRGTDALEFGPDGRLYAGGAADEQGRLVIAVWAPGEREPRLVPAHHQFGFWGMALSADGQRLATSDWAGRVNVWDARTMSILATHQFPPATRAVALDSTGDVLAVASDDFTVYVLDAVTGVIAHHCVGHTDIVTDVEFSVDGASVISGSADQTVRIWNAQTGALEGLRRGARGQVHALSVDPCGRYIAGGDSDGRILLWKVDPPPFDRRLAHAHGEVNRLAWDPSGARLASAADDGTVRIWNVDRSEELHAWRLGDDVMHSVAWSDDGMFVAAIALSGRVGVWRADTGQLVSHWRAHDAVGRDLVFVRGTGLLATCARESTLRIWDAETGSPRGAFEASAEIRAVDVTADGSTLLAGDLHGTVHAWRLDDGSHRRVFEGGLRTEDVRIGPGGDTMLVTQAGHVRACDLRTGRVLWDVEAHRQAFSASYSPDGARVVTAGDDGLMKVLDAATGRRLLTLRAHAGRVRDACFDPTGRRIASAGHNEVVRVWESR